MLEGAGAPQDLYDRVRPVRRRTRIQPGVLEAGEFVAVVGCRSGSEQVNPAGDAGWTLPPHVGYRRGRWRRSLGPLRTGASRIPQPRSRVGLPVRQPPAGCAEGHRQRRPAGLGAAESLRKSAYRRASSCRPRGAGPSRRTPTPPSSPAANSDARPCRGPLSARLSDPARGRADQ